MFGCEECRDGKCDYQMLEGNVTTVGSSTQVHLIAKEVAIGVAMACAWSFLVLD